jgi:Domain of unknown function (DUF4398)
MNTMSSLLPTSPFQSRRRLAVYGMTLVAAALGACATVPVAPTPEMTRAESAIEQARRAGAEQLAREPLHQADVKLASAKTAASAGQGRNAAALVEESYADARLADLTAQAVTAAKASAEVDKSISTLQGETNHTN